MADFLPVESTAFDALLIDLGETLSQLAKLYHRDVEAALRENEKLRVLLGDGSGGTALPLEESESFFESEGNEMIPTEKTYASTTDVLIEMEAQDHSPPAPPESVARTQAQSVILLEVESDHSSSLDADRPSAHPNQISRTLTVKKRGARGYYYQMRSPWVDQREFDYITLQDVMPDNMMASWPGESRVTSATNFTSFQKDGLLQGRDLTWLVLHPESRARGWWIVACIILLLYDFIMVPVDVCFDLEETAFSKAMDVTAATFWTMDIVFTFFVGVRQAHAVENRPAHIACLYLKSWFVFDLFLVVPEWLGMSLADDNAAGGQVSVFRLARWGRLMRLLRLARILKIAKLKPVIRRLVVVFNLSRTYIILFQRLAGLSVGLMVFIHIISCFWYAIGNSSEDGWVSVNGLNSASVGQAYAVSVHWSFTRLHGMQSYNKIESDTELLLNSLLIYVSLVLSVFYNGTVAALAMTGASAQSLNLWKLGVIFVQRHRISSGLNTKMVRFLEWSGIGGAKEAAAEDLMLLESLPKTLQHDLLFEARVQFLSIKPCLSQLLEFNPRMIRRVCIEAIAQKVYMDGEVVFANGDACHSMFFVTSGVLFYIIDSSTESLKSIQEKLYNPLSMGPLRNSASNTRQLERKYSVSEPVLWTQWTHLGSLLTIDESISLVLSQLEFSKVVTEHKDASCYAYKYAKHFLWKLNHTFEDIDDLTAFDEITVSDLDTDMFEGTEYDHFIFLSHYKVEAGTEATLMRDLFLEILREDPSHSANHLRSPIFVDSQDLTDMSKLKEHVKGSVALVLLLTPGVLSRPWCLVEIVTAVNHNVKIVPVDIQRPGSKYNYPDDQFYANILNGKFLNQAAVDLLQGEGISLSDVERAIRQVFLKIALPFSPHKTKGVREAELHDILARSSPGQGTFC